MSQKSAQLRYELRWPGGDVEGHEHPTPSSSGPRPVDDTTSRFTSPTQFKCPFASGNYVEKVSPSVRSVKGRGTSSLHVSVRMVFDATAYTEATETRPAGGVLNFILLPLRQQEGSSKLPLPVSLRTHLLDG